MNALTVGELKKLLEGAPDDMEVVINMRQYNKRFTGRRVPLEKPSSGNVLQPVFKAGDGRVWVQCSLPYGYVITRTKQAIIDW
jgi:hypothetical protein